MNDLIVDDSTVNNEPNTQDNMMLEIVKSGSVDALEKYLDLKQRTEAREAAFEFNAMFAAMQSQFSTVGRSKKGYGYNYVPLEALQLEYMPIISKHGFSVSWDEVAIENGKRCVMTISGYGHHRTTSFDIPRLEQTKQMNAVQAAGAMSTYGRRYTFIAGFGVIIADEDTDAVVPVHSAEDVHKETQALNAAKDLDELMSVWKGVYAKHKDSVRAIGILSAVKDDMKAKLV